MTCLITYRNSRHEIHNLDWAIPSGWSEAAIRAAFERQYPGSELLSIQQKTPRKARH